MPVIDALTVRSLMLIAQEVLIGVMLGFTLQLFFHLFSVAGQIIAVQMGLGFASMIDPANGVSVPVLAQMLLMLVTLLFLAMNGHLVVFEVLAESFITLPVGTGLSSNHYWELAGKLNHRAAGGQFGVWHHDSRRAAAEHHLHRLSDDPGHRPGNFLAWPGGLSRPVPATGERRLAAVARAGAGALRRRHGRKRKWRRQKRGTHQ
jgi:hypothetical protein